MKRISLADYAHNHGVSKQAASKWKARGQLVVEGNLVLVDASDQKLKAAGLGRYSRARPNLPGKTIKPPADISSEPFVDIATFEQKAAELDDDNLTSFIAGMQRGRTVSIADAASIKENALALKHTLQARQLQRNLIDVRDAERVLFECSREVRDAWLNFPSRVGPLIAAEVGVEPEKIVESLTEHVYRQLKDLGEPEADFGGPDESDAAPTLPEGSKNDL